jgi:flagellin
MSLRINTNVAALNSYNNLNANQAKLEAAFQQLSSGLRINKAADDAAGLSIAAGLTSQINGLTQAVSNANDGINVAQIADGALGTTQDILQRMRGLVVKAGNVGTQDSKSLGAIQQEIQNLNTQLDNIAGQTKFGQVNLLDGKYDKNFQVGANGQDTIELNLTGAKVKSDNVANTGVNLNSLNIATKVAPQYDATASLTTAGAGTGKLTTANLATTFGVAAVTVGAQDANGNWQVNSTATGTPAVGKISFDSNSDTYTLTDMSGNLVGTVNAAGNNTGFDPSSLAGTVAVGAAAANDGTLAAALKTAGYATSVTITQDGAGKWNIGDASNSGTVTLSNGVYHFSAVTGGKDAWIDSNAQATSSTGIANYSSADASHDLSQLDKAIDGISKARSQIGAVQNQLNYTVSNLQTAITNVTASRSNLTDADLAQQVTAMTQSQILTQAATSVLAQANSAPQAILKLLQ